MNKHGMYRTKFHNTWRSIRFTLKGKNIGFHPDWLNFDNFKKDMFETYIEDFRLVRNNKSEWFSKENCRWVDKTKTNEKKLSLTHNNETKTLWEWSLKYDLYYNGLRQRYQKGKNYTSEEILFGKKVRKKRETKSAHNLFPAEVRAKASKMISAYKNKDNKKNYCLSDITIDWIIENILYNNCTYCGTSDKIGADRLDNSKGHMKNNCVPCCYRCNAIRSNHFTYEQMLKIGKFIKDMGI